MSINYISLSAEHMAILSTKWGLLTSKKRNEAIEPGVIMMFVYFVNIGGLICIPILRENRKKYTTYVYWMDALHCVRKL